MLVVSLLALAAHPFAVSAEGDYERYRFYLEAHPDRAVDELCVGDVVHIDVAAQRFLSNRRYTDTTMNTNPPVQVYGVTIDGSVGNPAVGNLFLTHQVTTPQATPPGTAPFKFTALKQGTTTIVFKGRYVEQNWLKKFVSSPIDYLSTELEVTVRDCEYSVSATGRWRLFNLDYTSVLSDVRMKSSGGGHYAGHGVWTLMITRTQGCPNTQFYDAAVDLTGDLVLDRLSVKVAYAPPTGYWYYHSTFDCNNKQSKETLTQDPEALTLIIPSDGDSLSLPQTLLDTLSPALNVEGRTRVTIKPVVSR